jgi:hypothetical protein
VSGAAVPVQLLYVLKGWDKQHGVTALYPGGDDAVAIAGKRA